MPPLAGPVFSPFFLKKTLFFRCGSSFFVERLASACQIGFPQYILALHISLQDLFLIYFRKGGIYVYGTFVPADVLRELGMQPKYKGYAYLLFILQQTEAKPELMYSLSHELYPMVLAHFDIPKQNLERNIRFAIKRTWESGNKAAIRRLFGAYSVQDAPSVTEFITILTECMMCHRSKKAGARRARP